MSKQPSFKRARPAAPSGDQLFGWVKELVELTEQYTEFRRLGTQGDAAARAWLMKTLLRSEPGSSSFPTFST